MEVNINLEIEKPQLEQDSNVEEEKNKLTEKLQELTKKLQLIEGENELLKRQIHSAPPGGKKLSFEKVKEELERLKNENKLLKEDVEARKEHCSRLETENFEQKMRISHWRHRADEKTRENSKLSEEFKFLSGEKQAVQHIIDENIRLNGLLSRHNIDPTTGIKIMTNLTNATNNQVKVQRVVQINPYVQIHTIGDSPRRSSIRPTKSFEDVRPDSGDSIAIELNHRAKRESNVHTYAGLHRSKKTARHLYEFH